MKEEFLHFVWEHQMFDQDKLLCSSGMHLEILSKGVYNKDAGPDFHTGHVKIGDEEWVGNIEIHIHASEWELHGHQFDQAYDNVILHVVFEEDKRVKSSRGDWIPCLELKHRIAPSSVQRYINLQKSEMWISCQQKLPFIEKKLINQTLDEMLIQRLERKSAEIKELLVANRTDWSEALYVTLAKNFGFKVNALPFVLLARSISYGQIRKYQFNPLLVECILFGQAGFLEKDFADDYPNALKKEFEHQKNKLSLVPFPSSIWKKSKMRPNNFPILRLAQFAALLLNKSSILDLLRGDLTTKNIKEFFDGIEINPYWKTHSNFDITIPERSGVIGKNAVEVLLINTVAPFIYFRGTELGDQNLMARSLELLREIKPESNGIIRKWKSLGLNVRNAADSQALLELKNEQCSRKKCVSCGIGSKLIKPN